MPGLPAKGKGQRCPVGGGGTSIGEQRISCDCVAPNLREQPARHIDTVYFLLPMPPPLQSPPRQRPGSSAAALSATSWATTAARCCWRAAARPASSWTTGKWCYRGSACSPLQQHHAPQQRKSNPHASGLSCAKAPRRCGRLTLRCQLAEGHSSAHTSFPQPRPHPAPPAGSRATGPTARARTSMCATSTPPRLSLT